jgi:hypothetical protein
MFRCADNRIACKVKRLEGTLGSGLITCATSVGEIDQLLITRVSRKNKPLSLGQLICPSNSLISIV